MIALREESKRLRALEEDLERAARAEEENAVDAEMEAPPDAPAEEEVVLATVETASLPLPEEEAQAPAGADE
jgi:hypothetical protein